MAEHKGGRGEEGKYARLRGIGRQINTLDGQDVAGVVGRAELERRLAGDLEVAVAGRGVAAKEVEAGGRGRRQQGQENGAGSHGCDVSVGFWEGRTKEMTR